MFGNFRILYWEECTGTYVQTHCFHVNASGLDLLKDFLRKMKTCRRSCYRASYLGIKRLITFHVQSLAFPVQIRWNRDCSADLKHTGERMAAVPAEAYNAGFTFS